MNTLIAIAKVTSTRILDNGKRLIKALRFGNRDVVEIHFIGPAGVDSPPVPGQRTMIIPTSMNGQSVAVGVVATNQQVSPGEIRLFSIDAESLEEKAHVYLTDQGKVQLNGEGDFAVRFNELESGFNSLRSDLNQLVSRYNLHTHPDPITGSTGSTSAPGQASSASISGAKVDEVELPT